jgi:hypothetical protein
VAKRSATGCTGQRGDGEPDEPVLELDVDLVCAQVHERHLLDLATDTAGRGSTNVSAGHANGSLGGEGAHMMKHLPPNCSEKMELQTELWTPVHSSATLRSIPAAFLIACEAAMWSMPRSIRTVLTEGTSVLAKSSRDWAMLPTPGDRSAK